MSAVSFINYHFTYPNASDYTLKNINLTIDNGQYILICGPTGSGKTTLLRSIKSEIAPVGKTQGKILIMDTNRDDKINKKLAVKVGYVAQDPDNQIIMDSVWHELAFGLENMGLPSHIIRRRMAETAAFFSIDSWINKKTYTLSGGQKQILNLASVMAMQPDILILDEPTSQLDPIAAKEFLQMVKRINDEMGITVIISEHRFEDILSSADRVIFMEKGMIISDNQPKIFVKNLFNQNNSFCITLPAPVKIAKYLGESENYPLNVKQGRQWLNKNNIKLKNSNNNIIIHRDRKAIVLQAKNIWFRYDKQNDFVLRDTSFELYNNEIHAIVGANGSGKTTLMNILCGVYKPSRGKIKKQSGLKTGLLSQDPKALFTKDTLYEDLSLLKDKYEYNDNDIQNILNKLGLDKLSQRHPFDLSGGELQKAALAKILLISPDILILDEPTKGIDGIYKAQLINILKNLKQKGKTILIVTHDLEFAASSSDRCSMLFDGDIICSDTGKEFFSSNMFYTTQTNRMTRGFIDGCIIAEDIKHE